MNLEFLDIADVLNIHAMQLNRYGGCLICSNHPC